MGSSSERWISSAHRQPEVFLRPVFDEVLLFCPEVVTGGPEALHQLGYEINRLGGDAGMVYYGPTAQLEIKGDVLRRHGSLSLMAQHFAQYKPKAATEARLTPRTLVVYPEVLTEQALLPVSCARAVWWLSVDNAVTHSPRLQNEASRHEFFAHPELIHFYQSDYARAFLQKSGAEKIFPLSDYTDAQLIEESRVRKTAARLDTICFFPTKGAELARLFLTSGTLLHKIDMVPIHNMSKAQVRETLFNARMYIDFGHHPGKDRMPREAAAAGAIVLLHAMGAGNYPADHPLDAMYRFTAEDVRAGRLHERIDAILDNPQKHIEAQQAYRDAVFAERERFESEVRNFFFKT